MRSMSDWMNGTTYVSFYRYLKSFESDFTCCDQTNFQITAWDPGRGEAATACAHCLRALTFTESDLLILMADNPFRFEVEI